MYTLVVVTALLLSIQHVIISSASRFDHGIVDIPDERPFNIAHRGASGALPENTAEAVAKGIEDGADAAEFDICLTKDLRLVLMHESWFGEKTNVAEVFPEERMNTYSIDDQAGREITDYFTVDFTLEELKQVHVNQARDYRDHNYDGDFQIATFEEILDIIQSAGREFSPYVEIKDPIWVNSLDILTEAETTFEDLILDVLSNYGYTEESDPCYIQSFNEDSIRYVSTKSDLKLSLLMTPPLADTGDDALEELSQWCYAIGPNKRLIVQTNLQDQIIQRTDLVDRAHSFGLKVHAYTFRNEDRHLAWDYEQDPYAEYMDFLELEIDGFHTDFPASLARFLNTTYDD